uniref:Uncharacterized protein n=1 Tax=Strombidium inclinatum TaxID=197538 RepID=A0A7S3N5T2_9SPIT
MVHLPVLFGQEVFELALVGDFVFRRILVELIQVYHAGVLVLQALIEENGEPVLLIKLLALDPLLDVLGELVLVHVSNSSQIVSELTTFDQGSDGVFVFGVQHHQQLFDLEHLAVLPVVQRPSEQRRAFEESVRGNYISCSKEGHR